MSALDEVVAVVLDAIRDQGVGRAMPSLTALCDHYQTWRLRRALSELGWLRHPEHIYLTDESERDCRG